MSDATAKVAPGRGADMAMLAVFAGRFVFAAVAAACVFGAVAWASSAVLFQAPPQRQYLRGFNFELPPGWACWVDGAIVVDAVVCDAGDGSAPDVQITVQSGARRSVNATLESYRSTAGEPLAWQGGVAGHSTVVYARDVTLAGIPWIETYHHQAPDAETDTRLLATVHGGTYIIMLIRCPTLACPTYAGLFDRFTASIAMGARVP